MPEPQRFSIGEDDAERRIDALVRRRLGLPRSLVMKLLRTGDVRLNGRRAAPDAKLAAGDLVEVRGVRADPPEPAKAAPPADAGAGRDRERPSLRGIVFEDADLLVFDKPPGLVSHKGSGHERGVVDVLLEYLGDGARPHRKGDARPALVNRLDRDTSGLIVLAKTPLALRRLNETIRRGGLEKGYLALVRGAPEPPEGVVRAALRKELCADGLERMVPVKSPAPGDGALESATAYRTVRRLSGGALALLALAPETGRTHQIRAHMALIGHAIALDRKYGDARWNGDLEARAGLTRLFLHAETLGFPHPRTGAMVRFSAPLAADLATALARLEDR